MCECVYAKCPVFIVFNFSPPSFSGSGFAWHLRNQIVRKVFFAIEDMQKITPFIGRLYSNRGRIEAQHLTNEFDTKPCGTSTPCATDSVNDTTNDSNIPTTKNNQNEIIKQNTSHARMWLTKVVLVSLRNSMYVRLCMCIRMHMYVCLTILDLCFMFLTFYGVPIGSTTILLQKSDGLQLFMPFSCK